MPGISLDAVRWMHRRGVSPYAGDLGDAPPVAGRARDTGTAQPSRPRHGTAAGRQAEESPGVGLAAGAPALVVDPRGQVAFAADRRERGLEQGAFEQAVAAMGGVLAPDGMSPRTASLGRVRRRWRGRTRPRSGDVRDGAGDAAPQRRTPPASAWRSATARCAVPLGRESGTHPSGDTLRFTGPGRPKRWSGYGPRLPQTSALTAPATAVAIAAGALAGASGSFAVTPNAHAGLGAATGGCGPSPRAMVNPGREVGTR